MQMDNLIPEKTKGLFTWWEGALANRLPGEG